MAWREHTSIEEQAVELGDLGNLAVAVLGGQQSSGQGCRPAAHCSVTSVKMFQNVKFNRMNFIQTLFLKVETQRLLGNEKCLSLQPEGYFEIWAQILYMQYLNCFSLKSNMGILTSLQSLVEMTTMRTIYLNGRVKEIRVFYQCIFNLYP